MQKEKKKENRRETWCKLICFCTTIKETTYKKKKIVLPNKRDRKWLRSHDKKNILVRRRVSQNKIST
jgi:hypothetical protein